MQNISCNVIHSEDNITLGLPPHQVEAKGINWVIKLVIRVINTNKLNSQPTLVIIAWHDLQELIIITADRRISNTCCVNATINVRAIVQTCQIWLIGATIMTNILEIKDNLFTVGSTTISVGIQNLPDCCTEGMITAAY